MESDSPLLQAIRSSYDSYQDDNSVKTAAMSYDQMSYLLTIMITVSVISIIILIFSVTVILGFLW